MDQATTTPENVLPPTENTVPPVDKKKLLIISSVILLFLLAVSSAIALYRQQSTKKVTPKPSVLITSSPTPAQTTNTPSVSEPTPTNTYTDKKISPAPQKTITPIPTSARAPTPTATQTPVPIPTATPTKVPNPPQINISYPSEMQSIEMTSSQQLCVVDIPAGGDTSGLKRRHNINDAGWTSYENIFTLCLSPNEGINRIMLQYKNSYSEESTTYTRQFVFHRV